MSGASFDVGTLVARIGEVADTIEDATGRGLALAAEHVLGVATQTVPIEEGTLQDSGSIDVDPARLQASVYYDTPYAVRQHEELTYQHDAGRTAKWLENALNSERGTCADIISRAIRGEL